MSSSGIIVVRRGSVLTASAVPPIDSMKQSLETYGPFLIPHTNRIKKQIFVEKLLLSVSDLSGQLDSAVKQNAQPKEA